MFTFNHRFLTFHFQCCFYFFIFVHDCLNKILCLPAEIAPDCIRFNVVTLHLDIKHSYENTSKSRKTKSTTIPKNRTSVINLFHDRLMKEMMQVGILNDFILHQNVEL